MTTRATFLHRATEPASAAGEGRRPLIARFAPVALAVLALAGCGKKDDQETPAVAAAPTPTYLTVNDALIRDGTLPRVAPGASAGFYAYGVDLRNDTGAPLRIRDQLKFAMEASGCKVSDVIAYAANGTTRLSAAWAGGDSLSTDFTIEPGATRRVLIYVKVAGTSPADGVTAGEWLKFEMSYAGMNVILRVVPASA